MKKNKGGFKKGHIPWNKNKKWLKEKKCKGCKIIKPRLAFIGRQKRNTPYHLCRECRANLSNKYRKKYPKKFKEAKRKYILKKQFGITIEDYNLMLKKQNGVCGICDKKPIKKRLAVDHCHNTGKIRGLLCDSCNRGIGQLGDTIEMLKKAVIYLNK